jgi:uncharacterized protein YkwD
MSYKKILLTLNIILFSIGIINGQSDSDDAKFKEYIDLNNAEKRLEKFKDSESDLLLKLKQLEVINSSRARYKAPPVKLDILASRVANTICMQAANGGYISHWNESGELPYHRYAFAGGVDHVSENASGESFTGSYLVNDRTKAEMMIKFHGFFMAEKAPADGHKLNIIDPVHNYVGIGLYLDKSEFRYYEEFIDRYYEFGKIPQSVNRGEQFSITVSTKKGYYISYIAAYYEKALQSRSTAWLERSGSYQDFTENIAFEIGPWDISPYRVDRTYTIPISFSKPGIYYIQIYQDTKEYTGGGSFTTEGKIQASGLVIRVN